MVHPIYLDYNGTTPIHPEVIETMKVFLEKEFGNPSSAHWYGITPKRAIENARLQVAELLNCDPVEVVFTSGGTEANNHAIKGIAWANQAKGNHIITTRIEHPAVLEVCRYLEKWGFKTTYLPVDEYGLVYPEDVKKAILPETLLITVMHANNEVGTLEPIEDIGRIAKTRGIFFHTDAAQSIGKVPTDVKSLGVDLLSVAGHKIYAPKGVGALFIKKGTSLDPFCHGAGQERGFRGGTENVLEIVGLGKACEILRKDFAARQEKMMGLTHGLYQGLLHHEIDMRLNGHPELRLPNTLSLSFKGLEANRILEEIGLDVAASAGAACHSDTIEISHVLKAMNVPVEWAKGTIRFTTGMMTTEDEIHRTIVIVAQALKKLRKTGSH
ncbi:MAG: cysteine desulfurase [Desulfobacteraceae bacterium]|nr:cysteine desulfurase [Desulfobacteraceae bacterium]MBU4001483.1 cysteine desulfurase [Pseudomonadota bacterium]